MYMDSLDASVTNILVVAGGTSKTNVRQNQVFSTKLGSLPSLPIGITHTCLVVVSDETLFVAGGYLGSTSMSRTFIYTKSR
jgi:hypothetical protein